MYASLESLLSWDSHYWLQRGSLEVELEELRRAENSLNQARSLAPDDALIENEWAYLLFRKAIETPTSMEAPGLVAEAMAALDDLIRRRGDIDFRPYHVIGSQGLAWAFCGITDQREKERYLQGLVRRLEEGYRRHPKVPEFEQLLRDTRGELYSMRVARPSPRT